MWSLTRNRRKRFGALILLSIIVSLSRLSPSLLVGLGIGYLQNGTTPDAQAEAWMAGLFGLLICGWLTRVPAKLMQFRLAADVRTAFIVQLVQRLFAAPLAWHDRQHSGDTLSRLNQSSVALYSFTMSQFGYFEALLAVVVPLAILFALSPLVCLSSLLAYSIIAAVCLLVDRSQQQNWVREAEAYQGVHVPVIDGLRNILSIYASRGRARVEESVRSGVDGLNAASLRNVRATEAKWTTVDFLATMVSFGLLLLYVAKSHADGASLSLAKVFIVMAFSQSGLMALLSNVNNVSAYARSRAEFKLAQPILSLQTEAPPLPKLNHDWSEIRLLNVAFAYEHSASERKIFDKLAVKLDRGRHYALMGANGCGKSTLLKILAGLHTPSAGRLMIDGVETNFAALQSIATLIPQQVELLAGSVESNMFAQADRPESKERRALADSLIKAASSAPGAMVLEDGVNYSGGQRQRLALARGLLSSTDGSLFVIDEPTSSIDAESEAEIMEALRAAFVGSTLIVSIHNQELAGDFDDILVLRDGQIEAPQPAIVREIEFQHE